MSATCRTCGAPIIWALTVAGKRMPIDAEPHPDGKIIVVEGKAFVLSDETEQFAGGKARYQSHFATCPQAAKHRRERNG